MGNRKRTKGVVPSKMDGVMNGSDGKSHGFSTFRRVNAPGRDWKWTACVVSIAIFACILNRMHVATLFENDRHFSHLSSLEREMTFRTEMGLYYSYYKTLIEAPTLSQGMHLIMADNVTEYPSTINTLKRFNLYPEIMLGALYRTYKNFGNHLKWKLVECWRTERGKGYEPITSCEGMGDPFYFYVNFVFFVAGLTASAMFLYGVLLSNSIFGGLLVLAAFFFNHGECTRVQWTPPLRESFAYPIFLGQMLIVTYIIKYRLSGMVWSVIIACLTILFMLPWQFAQFALSTQVGSLFVSYMLDYIPRTTLRTIALGHLAGFAVAFCMLFGNEMLLTSLFISSLLAVQLLLPIQRVFYMLRLRIIIWAAQAFTFAGILFGIKFATAHLLHIKDDAHIFSILKAKFTNYSDFHTRLYTCAAEFDFMLEETPWKLCATLVLPAAVVAVILALVQVTKQEWPYLIWRKDGDADAKFKPYAEMVYNIIQLACFTVMAILIMRLKLFFTPHLCIITGILMCTDLLRDIFGPKVKYVWNVAICGILIAAMAVQGISNISHQRSIIGEYSNPTQEHLFDWIVKSTPPNAVFGGSMPVMANVKLSTLRPIVNHPHYEDAALRERTMRVYSIYSRKSHDEVYKILKDLGIQYLVFEYGWCGKGGKPGCSMPELWDLHDAENLGKTPLCDKIQQGNYGPFKKVFENGMYKVLRIE